MPSIAQLPAGQAVAGADILPIDQAVAGVLGTYRVSMSAVLTYIAANIAGGGGSYSITALPIVSTAGSADLVGISQSGADKTVTLAALLNGATIDQGSPAGAVADTDKLWVGQGSSFMAVQTFGAVWAWLAASANGKLRTWKRPVVEITANTQLDGSVHNGAIVVCSQALTISPSFVTEGPGFYCTVVNMSAGAVTLGAGITSSGLSSLATGQSAELVAFAYSGGSATYALVSGGSTTLAAPGTVTGVAQNGSATASAVPLLWVAPSGGGTPSAYKAYFKRHVDSVFTLFGTTFSGLTGTVAGLTASTAYDFYVVATNATSDGSPSTTLASVSTAASVAQTPNAPTSFAVSGTPAASSITMQWTAPATDGTHDAATGYVMQWSATGANTWSATGVAITGTQGVVTGLTASTGYDFRVQATNSNATASGYATVSNVLTAVNPPNVPVLAGTPLTSVTSGGATLNWAASVVDSTHGAATGYQVQYRTSAGPGSWQTTGVAIAGTQGVVTGLAAATGYDFEVQATNAGPTPSGWTSPASTTTASAGNYLLTSAPGTGGLTWAGGVALSTTNTSIAVNANDNTTLADGSHTAPGNVYFGWSASNTVAPTSLLAASGQATGIPGGGGSNLWYQWVAAPTTAGSYYFWAVAKNSASGGSVVRTLVSTATFTVS